MIRSASHEASLRIKRNSKIGSLTQYLRERAEKHTVQTAGQPRDGAGNWSARRGERRTDNWSTFATGGCGAARGGGPAGGRRRLSSPAGRPSAERQLIVKGKEYCLCSPKPYVL
jgi:hypothetical protein